MSVTATRARSLTTSTSTPSPRHTHFRPVRYQTKEELDHFFGVTASQKREQRLRVRDADGHVYYDLIEKDEWQHLLAKGGSPTSRGDRRRSSVGTNLSLNSPLVPSSPARRGSGCVGQSGEGMSPLAGTFEDVRIEDGERRGRKRSNSALAGRKEERVDAETPLSGGRGWTVAPGFKRRQSDTIIVHAAEGEGEMEKAERIRIARLPLNHRKMDQEALDAAFAVSNPLLDLSPDAALFPAASTSSASAVSRQNKPSALHIPSSATTVTTLDTSDVPRASTSRRGTFGPLDKPLSSSASSQFAAVPRRRRASDVGTPPSTTSSAMMEFLSSPYPIQPSSSSHGSVGRTLRHAASFDVPRQQVAPLTPADMRPFKLDDPPVKSPSPSFATLKTMTSRRTRRMSNSSSGSSSSSLEPCFTPLAPRRGAKKYDRTRERDLALVSSSLPIPATPESIASTLPPMRDPLALAAVPSRSESLTGPSVASHQRFSIDVSRQTTTTRTKDLVAVSEPKIDPTGGVSVEKKEKVKMGTGLRTGPEVYCGIDIPCASIHLHSDPEDNLEPALALSLTSAQKKKLLKKKSDLPRGHRRGNSGGGGEALEPAKGSGRWWSAILHS